MATFYIRTVGNDGNTGLSPAQAWLTIGKALGAAGIASGDTVYIGAGTYREVVTVAMTSPAAETRLIADLDGSQTGDAGEVIWTAYTTDDKTAPVSFSTLNLAGRNNLTFEKITFVGGNSAPTCVTSTSSTGITFRECAMSAGRGQAQLIFLTALVDAAANWTLDRCIFFGTGTVAVQVTAPTSAAADYDLNFLVRNCLFINGFGAVLLGASGAAAFKAGGVDLQNCSATGYLLTINSANIATSIPSTVYNSACYGGTIGLSASTSGQITENYNMIYASTPRTNVTAGANSHAAALGSADWAFLVNVGQWIFGGRNPRPFMMPMTGSPLLGFGNQAGFPTVDIWNRPRPAGGASLLNATGALERHDTAAKETTTTDAGSVGLVITGPGDHDLTVPVNAAATTISIKARYDTTHAATNKPQAILVANSEIGVATETLTMTAAVDTWEQLTFSSFTPTAKGLVTIRLVSRAAAGGGKAFFDTADVPDISTEDFAHYRRGEPFPAVTGSGAGGSAAAARRVGMGSRLVGVG
jgi:hypothetical protein